MALVRNVFLAVVAVSAIAITPGDAEACSCAGIGVGGHFAAADAVYVARAFQNMKVGKRWIQSFRVFETLKGKARRNFQWNRPAVLSPCHVEFKAGASAILFVDKSGDLHFCSGNFGLAGLRDGDFTQLLALAAHNRATAPQTRTVVDAVARGTKGFRHKRQRIEVRTGGKIASGNHQVGGTQLAFVQRQGNNQVVLREIVRAGNVTAVVGRYEREGLTFVVVMVQPRGHRTLKSGKHLPLKPIVFHVRQIET